MKASDPPERVGLGQLGERGLIRRIRRSGVAAGSAPGIEVGIGDDTAVLAVPPVIALIQRDLDLSGTEVGLLGGIPVVIFAYLLAS